MIENVRGSKPAPTTAEIQRVEAALDVKFNREYVEFICRNNGGKPDENIYDIPPDNNSNIHGVIPLDELIYEHSLFEDRTGPHIIPVMFDGCGNFICMDMSGAGDGDIYFLDHEVPGREALTLLAPSLDAFLDSVRPDDLEVSLAPGQGTVVWMHPDLQKIIDEQRKKK